MGEGLLSKAIYVLQVGKPETSGRPSPLSHPHKPGFQGSAPKGSGSNSAGLLPTLAERKTPRETSCLTAQVLCRLSAGCRVLSAKGQRPGAGCPAKALTGVATIITFCGKQVHGHCGRLPTSHRTLKEEEPASADPPTSRPRAAPDWSRRPSAGLLGAWPRLPAPLGHAPRRLPFADAAARSSDARRLPLTSGPAPAPPRARPLQPERLRLRRRLRRPKRRRGSWSPALRRPAVSLLPSRAGGRWCGGARGRGRRGGGHEGGWKGKMRCRRGSSTSTAKCGSPRYVSFFLPFSTLFPTSSLRDTRENQMNKKMKTP